MTPTTTRAQRLQPHRRKSVGRFLQTCEDESLVRDMLDALGFKGTWTPDEWLALLDSVAGTRIADILDAEALLA